MTRKRRSFSPEFKQEAASLVLDQGYTIPLASVSLGIGESAIRRWIYQLTEERDGVTPERQGFNPEAAPYSGAGTRCKRLELEKDILKNRLRGAPPPTGLETPPSTAAPARLLWLDSDRLLLDLPRSTRHS